MKNLKFLVDHIFQNKNTLREIDLSVKYLNCNAMRIPIIMNTWLRIVFCKDSRWITISYYRSSYVKWRSLFLNVDILKENKDPQKNVDPHSKIFRWAGGEK